jgi:hypothetical protein
MTNMNNNFELRLNDLDDVTGGETVALAVLVVAAAMGALVGQLRQIEDGLVEVGKAIVASLGSLV